MTTGVDDPLERGGSKNRRMFWLIASLILRISLIQILFGKLLVIISVALIPVVTVIVMNHIIALLVRWMHEASAALFSWN